MHRIERGVGTLAGEVAKADRLNASLAVVCALRAWDRGAPAFGSHGSTRCLAPSTVPAARGRTLWTRDLGPGCTAPVVGLDGAVHAVAGASPDARALASVGPDGTVSTPRATGPLGRELVVGGRGDVAVCTALTAGGELELSTARAWTSRRVAGTGGLWALAADRQGSVYGLDTAGQLVALAADGATVWRAGAAGRPGFLHLVAGDGCVFVTSPEGLHAWTGGSERWHLHEPATATPPAIDGRGNVYWAGRAGSRREILSATSDGRLRWRATLPADVDVRELAVASPGAVYAVGTDDLVRCFGRGGGGRVLEVRAAARPVVAQDGGLLVPGRDGALHALDGEGETRWTLRIGDVGACNSPAVAGDGTIYVTSTDGRLRAID